MFFILFLFSKNSFLFDLNISTFLHIFFDILIQEFINISLINNIIKAIFLNFIVGSEDITL